MHLVNFVLAGGTGFLGTALRQRLREHGHAVTVLTRTPRQPNEVKWDPSGSAASWLHVLEGADAVINLAGASISRRWTAAHKREMWNSRVRLTRTLVAAVKSARAVPSMLINASAVGIYGSRGDEAITEESAPGSGFLASLVCDWEKEALEAGPAVRVVLLRSGIVLAAHGGAFPQMALPFRLFVGGRIASGRQCFSWIHQDDWVAMVVWALSEERVGGPLNVTAPAPVTNSEFSQTLGRVMRRPAVLPVPPFALRLVVGELAGELITGQRVFPAKAQSLGFEFRYPLLEPALRAICRG